MNTTDYTDTSIKRQPLRYYGSKFRMADKIISYFPGHINYIEPCGGGGGVLLKKPRSKLETYNDIDGNVVNFFQVLRDRPDDLITKIQLTPWARSEYEQDIIGDSLERARRYFARSWMSYGGWPSGWRHVNRHESRPTPAYDMIKNDLVNAANRLIGVQIENRDWREVVDRYDNDTALIYFDPPYTKNTRVNYGKYEYEWTDLDHIEAAEILKQTKGNVVVSGYKSDLYLNLYKDWNLVSFDTRTNGSNRTECLWIKLGN